MSFINGLSYPLQVSENGNLKTSSGGELIGDHIYSVLETRPFERVMRADYGLPDYIFDTLNPLAIDAKISSSILDFVENIENLSVEGSWEKGDSGIYNVTIRYTVQGEPQQPINLSLVV